MYVITWAVRGEMSSTEADYDDEVAEPFRFNFEIAWEVANKGW